MLHLETNGLSYIRLCQDGRTVLLAEGSRVTTNTVHLILRNYLAAEAEVDVSQLVLPRLNYNIIKLAW